MSKVVSLDERKKWKMIRFELVQINIYTGERCHICGLCMEEGPILCAVKEGPHKGLRMCKVCLKAGKKKVNERLQRRIKSLEEEISELKSIAGRLDFPTYNEWQAAYKKHERKFLKESEKGN